MRERIEAITALLSLGDEVEADRRGRFLCPVHDDHTPSAGEIRDTGKWYCHACHEWGDVVDYVAHRDGISLGEAVEMLETRLGISSGEVPPHIAKKVLRKKKARAAYLAKAHEILCRMDVLDRRLRDARDILKDLDPAKRHEQRLYGATVAGIHILEQKTEELEDELQCVRR